MSKIKRITGLEIFDSRGNPTVAATVELSSGVKATAQVPSGASTGSHEAHELRDGGKRLAGKGVSRAVRNINEKLHRALRNKSVGNLINLDYDMCILDGTMNKRALGANAILAVSMACARAGAYEQRLPLYKYLQALYGIKSTLKFPTPAMNVLNGGRHADNGVDVQEFMIVPKGRQFRDQMRKGVETYQKLKFILQEKELSTGLGDEGGFAPVLKQNEQALELLLLAIRKAGFSPGKDIGIAIDVAASEFYTGGTYQFENKRLNAAALISMYERWLATYPIISIEDGLAEDDWDGWQKLTQRLDKKVLLVGDDLFVTSYQRLKQGIEAKVANTILIKLNQIGTVSETMATIKLAQQNKYRIIVSHRSGETTDDFIADLALAVGADYLKSGAPARSERLAKYNRLLQIENKS